MPLPEGREKKARFYRCTVDGCAVKGKPAYKDGSFRNGYAVCGCAAFGGQGRDIAAAGRNPAPADQTSNRPGFWPARTGKGKQYHRTETLPLPSRAAALESHARKFSKNRKKPLDKWRTMVYNIDSSKGETPERKNKNARLLQRF